MSRIKNLRTMNLVGRTWLGFCLTVPALGGAAAEIPDLRIVQETADPEVGRQPSSREEQRSRTIEEVVVTAQKRLERLIDVPQSVTVVSVDKLAKSGMLQFRDFADTIAGLNFDTTGAGRTQLSMRGVTTGVDLTPSVAVYVDEVPYGSSSARARASQLALDVGLFDLERIEVLRGPQGTLYGASAMGGLIKYVAKLPDTTRFGVDVQAGTSGTHDGGTSYNGSVVVNAPIRPDELALRATGFYSHDGGYIDNVALGKEDVNQADIYGGRVDMLATPTETLSIRLTGFAQDIARDGRASVEHTLAGVPVNGELAQRRFVAEPFDQKYRLVSGTMTYDLDWASLTSISSYQTARMENIFDNTASFLSIANLFGGPFSAVSFPATADTDKFTQEVRLASEGNKPLEWMFGGFYTHEDSEETARFAVFDLAGQPDPFDLGTFVTPSRYEEYAVFGDLTGHLTDEFDVSGGIRYSRNDQEVDDFSSGLFAGPTRHTEGADDVVTYLANARYHFGDRATGYLRYATGYRAGGPNFPAIDPATGLPVVLEGFEPDELKSYEVGFKAEMADGRFGFDVAGYYIDWSNVQVTVVRTGGFGGIGNARGGATVRGAELTLTARPTSALTATGAFAYQDPKLSQAEPDLGGARGERLPNVPRYTAALSADYELAVGSVPLTIGGTLRYIDDRNASFSDHPFFPQYHLPEYTTVDLRANFVIGSIGTQIYVRNVFDERGQLSAAASSVAAESSVAIMQPLTAGITFTWKL